MGGLSRGAQAIDARPRGRRIDRCVAGQRPDSLAALAMGLDPTHGRAVVAEGLLDYLPSDEVTGLWSRIDFALDTAGRGARTGRVIVARTEPP